MPKHRSMVISCILFLILFATVSEARTAFGSPVHKQIRYGGFGVKLGVLNTGLIKGTEKATGAKKEYDAKPGISFGFFFDFPLFYGMMICPSFDWHHIRIYEQSQTMIDVAFTLKPYIYKPYPGLAIRFAASAGFAYLASWEIIEATSYMTIKIYTEVLFFTHTPNSWLIELGYLAMPTGGNGEFSYTVNPSLFLRTGLMF